LLVAAALFAAGPAVAQPAEPVAAPSAPLVPEPSTIASEPATPPTPVAPTPGDTAASTPAPAASDPARTASEPTPDPRRTSRLRPVLSDRGWQVDLTGFMQADLIAYNQQSVDDISPINAAQTLNLERFDIPRARVRTVAHNDRSGVFGAFEIDGNTRDGAPTARLLGAQVGWTSQPGLPDPDKLMVAVSAGLMLIPFGVDVPQDLRDNPFLEQAAFSRALFPGNFDAGVKLEGRYSYARWSLAMMNGAPVADAQWKGQDPTSSFDFLGRIGAEVPLPAHLRVEAGVSGLTGQSLHAGIPPTKDGFQWVDENKNGIIDPGEIEEVAGNPGEPSQTFSHNALGADFALSWRAPTVGNGKAFFEGVLSTNLDRGLVYSDPVALARDARQLGYQVGVVQDVGRYAMVGVRYDRYDADRDALDREGANLVGVHKIFTTLALMATARWGDAKLIFEYDRNRNPFGRADDGAPITAKADQLAIRGQVGF
jgi:hypothetical protein